MSNQSFEIYFYNFKTQFTMKTRKTIINISFSLIAAVGAIITMSNSYANRSCYTKTTGPCHLIFCRCNNDLEGLGVCTDSNPKYCNSTCTTHTTTCYQVMQQ